MATSLSRQLKKLAVPETQIFSRQDKVRSSLLFDPKEAASYDKDIFFSIGINGLQELQALDSNFKDFEEDLFGEIYKSLERTIQPLEFNQKLDVRIKEFLIRISPYFMLKPSLQALEWMIYRFHINVMNEDAILTCILPYHETNYFTRVIQTMDFKNGKNLKWIWLKDIQTNGTNLLKTDLFKHASKDLSFLNFVCQLPQEYIKIFLHYTPPLQTIFAFYVTTVIGTINVTKINEDIVSTLAPYIEHGIKSDHELYVSSSYMILTALSQRMKLKAKFWRSMINIISRNIKHTLFEHMIVCLVTIVDSQKCQPFTKKSVERIAISNSSLFIRTLTALNESYDITHFLAAVCDSLIGAALANYESEPVPPTSGPNPKKIWKTLVDLLKSIPLDMATADAVINCLIENFIVAHAHLTNHEDGSSSKPKLKDLKASMGKVVNLLDKKYPASMERLLSRYLAKPNDSKDSAVTQTLSRSAVSEISAQHVRKAVKCFVKIATSPKYLVLDTSKTTLHLSLMHPSAEIRKMAVRTMLSNLKSLYAAHEPATPKPALQSFAHFACQALITKLEQEDDAQVLKVVFQAPKCSASESPSLCPLDLKRIFELACPGEDSHDKLATALITFLKNPKDFSKPWMKLYKMALDVLVNVEGWNPGGIGGGEGGDAIIRDIRSSALGMFSLVLPYFFAQPQTLYLVRKLSESRLYLTFPLFDTLRKSEWRSLLSNKYTLERANVLLVESVVGDIAGLTSGPTQLRIVSHLVSQVREQLSSTRALSSDASSTGTAHTCDIFYFLATSIYFEWLKINKDVDPDSLRLLRDMANDTLTCLAKLKEKDLRRCLGPCLDKSLPWQIILNPHPLEPSTDSPESSAPRSYRPIPMWKAILMATLPQSSNDSVDRCNTSSSPPMFDKNVMYLTTTRQLMAALAHCGTKLPSYEKDKGGDLRLVTNDEGGRLYLETLVSTFKVFLLKSIQSSVASKKTQTDSQSIFDTLLRLFAQEIFLTRPQFLAFLSYVVGTLCPRDRMESTTIQQTFNFPYDLMIYKMMNVLLGECMPHDLSSHMTAVHIALIKVLGPNGLNCRDVECREVCTSVLKVLENQLTLAEDTSKLGVNVTACRDLLRYVVGCQDGISKDSRSILNIFSPRDSKGPDCDRWMVPLTKVVSEVLGSGSYSTATKIELLRSCSRVDNQNFFATACEPVISAISEKVFTVTGNDSPDIDVGDLERIYEVLILKYSPAIAKGLTIGTDSWTTFLKPLIVIANDPTSLLYSSGEASLHRIYTAAQGMLRQVTDPLFYSLPSDQERLALCRLLLKIVSTNNQGALNDSRTRLLTERELPLHHPNLTAKCLEVLKGLKIGPDVFVKLLTSDTLSSPTAAPADQTAPCGLPNAPGPVVDGIQQLLLPFSPSITKLRRLSSAAAQVSKERKSRKSSGLPPLPDNPAVYGLGKDCDTREDSVDEVRVHGLITILEVMCHRVPHMTGDDGSLLLPTIFSLLNSYITSRENQVTLCGDDQMDTGSFGSSEQEYIQQLVLTLCASILETASDANTAYLEAHFKVDTVLACLRATRDSRTQQQALNLLTLGVKRMPHSVLHHTVSLFTFMSQRLSKDHSNLPLDDDRSFATITRTLEAILPAILSQPPKKGRSKSRKRKISQSGTKDPIVASGDSVDTISVAPLSKLEITALRVFTDAAPHIPSHRRQLLYQKLITILIKAADDDKETSVRELGDIATTKEVTDTAPVRLNLLAVLLMSPKSGDDEWGSQSLMELCVDVYNTFPHASQISACITLVHLLLYIIVDDGGSSGPNFGIESDPDYGRSTITARYTTYEPPRDMSAVFGLYEKLGVIPGRPLSQSPTDLSSQGEGPSMTIALTLSQLLSKLLASQILKNVSKEDERLVRQLLSILLKCQVILTTLIDAHGDSVPIPQAAEQTTPKIRDKPSTVVLVSSTISRGLRLVMGSVSVKHMLKSLNVILSDPEAHNESTPLGQKTLEMLSLALASRLSDDPTDNSIGKTKKRLFIQMVPALGKIILAFTSECRPEHKIKKKARSQHMKKLHQMGTNAQLAISCVKRITTLIAADDTRNEFKCILGIVLDCFLLFKESDGTSEPLPRGVQFAAALCLSQLNSALGGTALLAHFNTVIPMTLDLIVVSGGDGVLVPSSAIQGPNDPSSLVGADAKSKTAQAGLHCGLSALTKYLSTPACLSFLHPFIPDIITQTCILSSLVDNTHISLASATKTHQPHDISRPIVGKQRTETVAVHAAKVNSMRSRLDTILQQISGSGLETRLFLTAMISAYPKLMSFVTGTEQLPANVGDRRRASSWNWIYPYMKLLTDHISSGHSFNNTLPNQTLLQNAFLEHYLNFNTVLASSQISEAPNVMISFEDARKIDCVMAVVLVMFVVKMSEHDLKPYLLELAEWAASIDTMEDGSNGETEGIERDGNRSLAKLSLYFEFTHKLALKLDVLFLLFVGPIFELGLKVLQNSIIRINSNREDLAHIQNFVIGNVCKTFHRAILVDDGSFMTKERFTALSAPLVDLLDYTSDATQTYESRNTDYLIPLITDMICGFRDDTCWKSMNHSILLKTKHSKPKVRIAAIKLLHSIFTKCGEDYLTLLPESTSYIAELMEDEDVEVESECHKLMDGLEKILGEPLQKYF